MEDGVEDPNHDGRIDPGERDPNEPSDDIPPEDAGPDAAPDAGVDSGPPDAGIDAGVRDYDVVGGCHCGVAVGADRSRDDDAAGLAAIVGSFALGVLLIRWRRRSQP